MARLRRFCGIIAPLVLAAGLASCGSSDSESDSGASNSGSPGVAAAKDMVAKYSAEQEPISVPALTKPVPKDKTVAIVTCPLPVCTAYSNGAEEAAKKLGWTVQPYVNPFTPEGYIGVWNDLLQKRPDAILYIGGLPNSIITKQLAQVKQLEIPTVEIAPGGDAPSPEGPVEAVTVGPPHFKLSGELMGSAVVADGGESAKALFVWDKTLELLWTPIKDGVTSVVTDAGGSVDVVEVPQRDIGKSAPTQIVNYLKSHPDVKYVVPAVADYLIGVAPALAAAGLDGKVKIVSRAPQAGNLEAIKSGSELAHVAEEESAGGYRAMDALMRLMLGEDMSCCTNPVGWHQLIYKSNVTDTSGPPETPGSPDAFLKAWGLAD